MFPFLAGCSFSGCSFYFGTCFSLMCRLQLSICICQKSREKAFETRGINIQLKLVQLLFGACWRAQILSCYSHDVSKE